jgi:membrane fusion protein (multidrug efflux system)
MAATAQSETLLGTPDTDDYRAETTAPPVAAKRPKALYVLGGLLTAAAVAVAGFYVHGFGRQSTDDAQVEGRIVGVSARISGQVSRVLVVDNQIV